MMLSEPAKKYRPFNTIHLHDRTWPERVISTPPIWMSTDLRDGNQALIEPMNAERKLRLFKQAVKVGLKEIEVAFPAASQTDFDFVRMLIEKKHVPEDVTIEVLTQAREDLIRRTIDSLQGARRAIVHLYNAVAPSFRRIVFNMSREEVIGIAVSGTRLIKTLTQARPETEWVFQYSPEVFSSTELEFAKEVCDAVSAEWAPTPERRMIINLPATIESSTPNVYADQIEWMHRHLARRESIILSVHPHNDRGTAVAAAELAVMAGADRVEGCLFGNGERTGNVDLVTLALNLYTQGVHPGLDFSDIDEVRACIEQCTQLPVHPRHPYAGELVFTAFSGSHQDAIRKGFACQKSGAIWEVPYLPIDPVDLGRSYDAVIRVNSQSGKGGIAYLMEKEHGLRLPRRLQIEFSRVVQQVTDESGKEMDGASLMSIFSSEYLERQSPYRYCSHSLASAENEPLKLKSEIDCNGKRLRLIAEGKGPLDAFVHALNRNMYIVDYSEHGISDGADARAISFVELRMNMFSYFGAGIDADIVVASFKAVLSALNRSLAATTQYITE